MLESHQTLAEAFASRIPERAHVATRLMAMHADTSVFDLKVKHIIGGLRGVPALLWEISQTDRSGVRYHGKTLSELELELPKWPGSEQLSPEAMMWFLYTGSIPSAQCLKAFVADLAHRTELPEDVKTFCDSIPSSVPPVTQILMVLPLLSRHARTNCDVKIERGASKQNRWTASLEDALDASARIPALSARIYANVYRQGKGRDEHFDPSMDLAANFAKCMGRSDHGFVELIRLYWALHMDHGTNVSAHTARELFPVCISLLSA
jgi:citrate synthase